jgi:hypothetical protein
MSLAVAWLTQGDALCASDASPRPTRFERASLCVTNGAILALPKGRLAIDSPSSRAVARAATTQDARILFQYLGPTQDSKPLASGVLRRQIGIKLRAQDSCNLVYAMWHIDPDTRVAVAIKRNDGQHTHAECGAHGYTYLKPARYRNPPPIAPGQTHELRATLKDGALTVLVDSQAIWEGYLGAQLGAIDGPVGIRTDNARFELEFFADPLPTDAQTTFDPLAFYHCEAGPAD